MQIGGFMKNLKIYILDTKYINYLRKYDERVPYNKNNTRPYVGVVLRHNNFNYFAPLASPKEKHIKISNKAIDVFKIKNGKLGVININNMIPTPVECLTELLPNVKDIKYKNLLEDQLTFINNNKQKLFYKINFFYSEYQRNFLNENIMKRCCNFNLLEKKCLEYQKLESKTKVLLN